MPLPPPPSAADAPWQPHLGSGFRVGPAMLGGPPRAPVPGNVLTMPAGTPLPPMPRPRPPSKFGTAEIVLVVMLLMVGGAYGVITVARQVCGPAAVGTAPDLPADQNANAQTIAQVALDLTLGKQGVLVGITVALTESGLVNVNKGDIQNGSMTSSRGLFQQLDAWGPLEDRLSPAKSATMFYTGGQAGQPGLTDIPGWETMPVPAAAQAVEQSEFTDGSNYARNLAKAQAITDALTSGGGGSCQPLFTGPAQAVKIPDDPYVAPEVRGQIITAPTPAVATGIATGLVELGQPYVWGGAGDDGCTRGGHDLNACQGITGWDCSGLARHVLLAADATDPGEDSATQRNPTHAIPWDQGQPGDLIGFPGHIALYLGTINGTQYILEASEVGVPVHVVPLTRSDHDPTLYRYWS